LTTLTAPGGCGALADRLGVVDAEDAAQVGRRAPGVERDARDHVLALLDALAHLPHEDRAVHAHRHEAPVALAPADGLDARVVTA